MIFSSKNESGTPAWKLVMNRTKTVTRRLKPVEVGKIRAVQPSRCKKAVGYIKVLSCVPHSDWFVAHVTAGIPEEELYTEAQKEGFLSWHSGVGEYFRKNKISIGNTYRIEFEMCVEEYES